MFDRCRDITQTLKCVFVQLALAITILCITAHIVNRYQKLVDQCPPDSQGLNCQNEGFVLGAMKYSLVPPILAICDTIVWVVDSYLVGLPYTFVIWCAWLLQGFYMGGGCVSQPSFKRVRHRDGANKSGLQTLASRINGDWRCQNPEDGGAEARLCNEFYADIALMWVAVPSTWITICFLYKLRAYYPRGMTTDSTEYRESETQK